MRMNRGRQCPRALLALLLTSHVGCSYAEQTLADYPWMYEVILGLAVLAALMVSNTVRLQVFKWRAGLGEPGVKAHRWGWTMFWISLLLLILLTIAFHVQRAGY